MENFNQKYRKWKQDVIELINTGGIPLAVVADFLATLQGEIARTLAQEAQNESLQTSADEDVV